MSPEFLNMSLASILKVLAIAASPISELRGAIPVAITVFHLPWYYAFLVAVIGNLLPVPLILLFLDAASRLLARVPLFARWLAWLFRHTRRRGRLIQCYQRIGLVLFVALPLPITGAWTGAVAAVLFGLRFKHAFLAISIGVVIAGIIVTCITLFGWRVFGLLAP